MPAIGQRRKKGRKGPEAAKKLPKVLPHNRCRLRLLKLNRINDWLLLEEEFIKRSQINVSHELMTKKKKAEEEEEREHILEFIRGCAPQQSCLLFFIFFSQ